MAKKSDGEKLAILQFKKGRANRYVYDQDEAVDVWVDLIKKGEKTIEDVPFELQTNVKSILRSERINEGTKMKITRSMIRNIVNETLDRLLEEEDLPPVKAVKTYYLTKANTETDLKDKNKKLARELRDLGITGEDVIMKTLEAAGRLEGESFAAELAGLQEKLKEGRRIRRRLHEEIENDQYETLLLLYNFTVDTNYKSPNFPWDDTSDGNSSIRSDFNIILEDVAKDLAAYGMTALRDIERMFGEMIINEPEKTAKLKADLKLADLTLESIPELIFNEQRGQRSFPSLAGIDESKKLRRLIHRELRQQGII